MEKTARLSPRCPCCGGCRWRARPPARRKDSHPQEVRSWLDRASVFYAISLCGCLAFGLLMALAEGWPLWAYALSACALAASVLTAMACLDGVRQQGKFCALVCQGCQHEVSVDYEQD